MDVLRRHIEDALAGCGERLAAGLFDQHRHRIRFVHQAQLAVGCLLRRRIQEHAALQQDAVHVGDHRADIPTGIAAVLRPIQISIEAVREAATIAFVTGVAFADGGRLQATLDQHERANGRIQHEHVHAIADGQDEDRR